MLSDDGDHQRSDSGWLEALAFGMAAAVVIQMARLASGFPNQEPTWLIRNAGLAVIPFPGWYFARRRGLSLRQTALMTVPLVAVTVVINVYPYAEGASTGTQTVGSTRGGLVRLGSCSLM